MRPTANPRTQALLLLAVTAVMWSLGGLLIKSIALNPLAVTGVRSAIAALEPNLGFRHAGRSTRRLGGDRGTRYPRLSNFPLPGPALGKTPRACDYPSPTHGYDQC